MRSNSLRLDRGNEHFDVAKKYLLSGTGAPPRIYPLIGRPLYLERADGPYLYDLDGNRFIDFHNLAGAALLGHNHPGIKRRRERGLYFRDPGHRIVPIHHGITAAHDEGVIDEALNRLDDLFSAF